MLANPDGVSPAVDDAANPKRRVLNAVIDRERKPARQGSMRAVHDRMNTGILRQRIDVPRKRVHEMRAKAGRLPLVEAVAGEQILLSLPKYVYSQEICCRIS